MMKVTNKQASAFISKGLAFTNSTGSFKGFEMDRDTTPIILRKGWMPDDVYVKMLSDYQYHLFDYVVMSYGTVIAYRLMYGGWVVPDISYSSTTAKHQSIVRNAIA